jgi:hypothetical protein
MSTTRFFRIQEVAVFAVKPSAVLSASAVLASAPSLSGLLLLSRP